MVLPSGHLGNLVLIEGFDVRWKEDLLKGNGSQAQLSLLRLTT